MSAAQCIMRIAQGSPIPEGWSLAKWLGTESGLIYGPSLKADVVLVERVEPPAASVPK